VSTTADVAVLVPAGGRRARADRDTSREADRPLVRLVAFGALGLYGTLRWATMLSPAPQWRLLGLLAVAIAVAGLGGALAHRSRALVLAVSAVALVAAFPLAGVPLSWVRHVRIAVSADGIGQGLTALPRALVPYTGVNEWLRTVIVLGAAVLLLDGALMLAFAPRRLSDARRAAVALPLVALAVVPSTLNRPALAYVHGLVLFALVAAFMWGDRLRSGNLVVAGILAALAGAGAMIAAPALDQHAPWLNYQALAGNLAPAHLETFDWTQGYGPLHWPRKSHEVFDVQAPRPDYWKTENLEVFDGRGWAADSLQVPDPQGTIEISAKLKQWTETLHVTIRGMRTTDVIAAGVAGAPNHAGDVTAGVSAGTWMAPAGLGPGDSYTVGVYAPHPSAAQLEAAGTAYPEALIPSYVSLLLPPDPQGMEVSQGSAPQPAVPVYIPPFGSGQQAAAGPPNLGNYKAIIKSSVYARAAALAQRLLRHATTPYDYVMSVKTYLSHGFTYDENPPASAYPLETFLFKTKRGYCQQFAGAMALLLRLGGVPARVATGFTTGTYDSATHSWVVSDLDAHAWVEAWFPHYGWVRFDPTPPSAPALGGHLQLAPIKNTGALSRPGQVAGAGGVNPVKGVGRAVGQHRGGGAAVPLLVLVGLLGILVLGAVAATVRLGEPSEEQSLAELERALARCGRPLRAGTTLAAIERRFGASPEAQEYVRALRLSRFADAPRVVSRAQRRALRVQLRDGLGPSGLVRSLWALPPRITIRRDVPEPPLRGIKSG
jgi:protein-glutamine gamma-glutamyltransferase